MPATVAIEHLTGASGTPVAVPVGGVRFRSDDSDATDTIAPVSVPAARTEAFLRSAVVAAPTAQTAQVISSAGFETGGYVIVEPGMPTQEVVLLTAVPDAVSLTAIFERNHAAGSLLKPVTASVGKVLRLNIKALPSMAIARVSFFRYAPLPTGVFDQFQVMPSYVEQDSTPWASDALGSFAPVPEFTARQLIATGPFRTLGAVTPSVAVQWLYTADSNVPLDASAYRFSWQES